MIRLRKFYNDTKYKIARKVRSGAVEMLFRTVPMPVSSQKKILIYSPVPWELGRIELGIGLALKTRGYDVVTYICGGGFSACEMENAKTLRPPCETCVAMATNQQAPFGFTPKIVSGYLRPDDFDRARRAAQEWHGRDLSQYTYEGMPVGLNVSRYLHNYYHAVTYETDYDAGHVLNARRCLESSIFYFVAARRILAHESPDILILTNGKNLVFYPFFYHAQMLKIRTVTWDETVVFEDSLIFNQDCFANEIRLEHNWPRWQDIPLSQAEDKALEQFLHKRQAGVEGLTPIKHGEPAHLEEQLRSLGWNGKMPIVAVFPNMAWDTAVIGRDLGFASLIEWLHTLVDLCRRMSDRVFMFRIHPHEVVLPRHYATSTPTASLLERFAPLSDNLIIIPPAASVNSYALGQLAEHRVLYTGSLGLEFAVAGLPSLICGDVHYRGKGFTHDVEDAHHLEQLLADPPPFQSYQQDLARRYMYLFVFRHLVRVGAIGKTGRYIPDEWFGNLLPGASVYWENFLSAVVGDRDFDFGPNHE